MKILMPLLLLLGSGSVVGSDWVGTVTYLKAQSVSKTVFFKLSGDIDKPARCNESLSYAIDLQSPGGPAIFALVQYALVHQLAVKADSLHTCEVYWKAEGVKELTITP